MSVPKEESVGATPPGHLTADSYVTVDEPPFVNMIVIVPVFPVGGSLLKLI